MSVSISISDRELAKFNKNISKYDKNTQQGIKKQVKDSAVNVQRFAVDNIRGSGLRDVRKSYKYDKNLANSIKIKRAGFSATIFTNLFYAIFREKGTRPHKITAKNKPYLVFKIPTAISIKGRKTAKNTWVRVKSVNHPGTTAAPFMKPAAKKERPNFINRIRKTLRKG